MAGALLAAADGDPLPPDAHLVVAAGEPAGRRFPVRNGALLGRGRRADLVLANPAASRFHARLLVAGPLLSLEDLGSKNGLTVNGRPASGGTVTLRDGDRIAIGGTVLVVERASRRAEGEPASPQPAPPPAEGNELDRAGPRRRRAAALAALALLGAAALCAIAGLG